MEEPLPAGGSCLLGSINLSMFVKDKEFDIDSFVEAVDIGIRFLNDVLDEGLPKHPLKEQRETVRDWRQCGLGIMGLADMLIEMEIPYSSPRASSITPDTSPRPSTASTTEPAAPARTHTRTFPLHNARTPSAMMTTTTQGKAEQAR